MENEEFIDVVDVVTNGKMDVEEKVISFPVAEHAARAKKVLNEWRKDMSGIDVTNPGTIPLWRVFNADGVTLEVCGTCEGKVFIVLPSTDVACTGCGVVLKNCSHNLRQL